MLFFLLTTTRRLQGIQMGVRSPDINLLIKYFLILLTDRALDCRRLLKIKIIFNYIHQFSECTDVHALPEA